MTKIFSRLASPTFLLYLFVVVTQLISGFYLAHSVEPPPAYTFLYSLGFLWLIGWWVKSDSRKYGIAWVMDMGLFLYIAWVFFMPYYLVKTRGVKGLLYLLAFIAVYLTALVIGAALYIIIAG